MQLLDLLLNRKGSKEYYHLEDDNILASDIVSGFDLLTKHSTLPQAEYYKIIKNIESNNVYNSEILYKDLYTLFKSKAFDNVFKQLRQRSGNEEQTNIDNFFEQLVNLSPEDLIIDKYSDITYLDYYDVVVTLLEHKERIKDHLKLKILDRYLKSEIRNKNCEKQSKLSLGYPLILHLREFINNTFNVKKNSLGTFFIEIQDLITFLSLKENGRTSQNRYVMLFYKG